MTKLELELSQAFTDIELTKLELELSQAFTDIEFKIKQLRNAHDMCKNLGDQKHSYWDSWIHTPLVLKLIGSFMTKLELELSQAFTDIEFKIKQLRNAHDMCKNLGDQKHSYWDSWILPVEKSLAKFKTKFYNIMLEIEEPE